MDTVILTEDPGSEIAITFNSSACVEDLFSFVTLPQSDYYIVCNGRIVGKNQQIEDGRIYRVVPRMLGGKGGFGSMLRALGAQIEKTTNREACRDLSGRRMRDVNNEKQLKDWIDKGAEREQEKKRRQEERREKRKQYLEGPKHKFDDPEYHKQKSQVMDELQDALQQGLQAAAASTSGTAAAGATTSRKRKAQTSAGASASKKSREWLGLEGDFDSSSSSDDDSDDSAVPGPSSVVSALPDVAPSTSSQHHADSDSGVESTTTRKTPLSGNSPMDVDSAESDLSPAPPQHKDEHDEERMQTSSSNKPDLLASLPPPKNIGAEVDLLAFDTPSSLEVLGLDGLKTALMARGMKCGGTLQQRVERLWEARGKTQQEIDPSLLATAATTKSSKGKGKGKKT